jgi:hypothetical protein
VVLAFSSVEKNVDEDVVDQSTMTVWLLGPVRRESPIVYRANSVGLDIFFAAVSAPSSGPSLILSRLVIHRYKENIYWFNIALNDSEYLLIIPL